MNKPRSALCPCGSGNAYAACCGLLHQGAPAPSAVALMRSRYSAYAMGMEAYLLQTWHGSTRPARIDLATPPQAKWLGLEIRVHSQDGADRATVEFVARYRLAGRGQRLHELSRFLREAGRWYYVDGEMR